MKNGTLKSKNAHKTSKIPHGRCDSHNCINFCFYSAEPSKNHIVLHNITFFFFTAQYFQDFANI